MPYLTINDGQFEISLGESTVLLTADPNEIAEYLLNHGSLSFTFSSAIYHPEEYGLSTKVVKTLFELVKFGKHTEAYKTLLSPLYRELIVHGLQLAKEAEDLWGLEDRERAEEALNAVRALLDGGVAETSSSSQRSLYGPLQGSTPRGLGSVPGQSRRLPSFWLHVSLD